MEDKIRGGAYLWVRGRAGKGHVENKVSIMSDFSRPPVSVRDRSCSFLQHMSAFMRVF